MARSPIYAAGGIVVRGGGKRRPLIAVVQRRKDDAWVLPRGKLKRDENPVVGARREALEETGHRVKVHEFLGALTYRARGRSKVVQFWRMQAYEQPSRDVMKDIVAVEWLPLPAAVRRLTYPLERLFLQFTGRRVLKRRKRPAKKTRARRKARASARRKPARRSLKPRVRKSRTRKLRAPTRHARARTAKTQLRRRTPRHRHKPHPATPVRIAAAKQIVPIKVAAPAHIATAPVQATQAAPMQAAPLPITSAKSPGVLERVLGRLAR
jgi:8-oxo-dGTP diphosphatase